MSGSISMQLLLLWLPLLLLLCQLHFPLVDGNIAKRAKRDDMTEAELKKELDKFLTVDVPAWPTDLPTPPVEHRIILYILTTSGHCNAGGKLSHEDSITVAYKSCLLSATTKTALGANPKTVLATDEIAFKQDYEWGDVFKSMYETNLELLCPSANFYTRVKAIPGDETLCSMANPELDLLKGAYQVMENFAVDDFIHRIFAFSVADMPDKANFVNYLHGILLTEKIPFSVANQPTALPTIKEKDKDDQGDDRIAFLASYFKPDELKDAYSQEAAHATAKNMATAEQAGKLKSFELTGSRFPLATFNLDDFSADLRAYPAMVRSRVPLSYEGLVRYVFTPQIISSYLKATAITHFPISQKRLQMTFVKGKFAIYLAQKFYRVNFPVKTDPSGDSGWPWYYKALLGLLGIGTVAGVAVAYLYLTSGENSTLSSLMPTNITDNPGVNGEKGGDGLELIWIVLIVLLLSVALIGVGFYAYKRYYRGKAGGSGGAGGGDSTKKKQQKEDGSSPKTSNTSGAKSSVDSTSAGSSTAS